MRRGLTIQSSTASPCRTPTSDLPWHSFDDKAYEFVSIYRRHFRAPAAWRGKRVFVDFGGAMTAAKVTINGHAFDEYRGGYTPFSFELTPHLKYRRGQPAGRRTGLHRTRRYSALRRQHRLSDFRRHLSRRGTARGARDVPGESCSPSPCACWRAAARWWRAATSRGPIAKPVTITAELRDGDRVLKSASAHGERAGRISRCHCSKSWAISNCGISARPKLYTGDGAAGQWRPAGHAHRLSRGAIHGQRILPERRARQAARPEPAPDLSLHRRRHAGARAGARRHGAAQGTEVQHRAHFALSAIAARFWMPATKSGCWCWRRFPAGSTSATRRGRIWRWITSGA